jgi:D-glycero-alpha-D-manno-heptose-7-phosphate kinase
MIITTGSVRVDLLGGTLDLSPINMILPGVVTLNLATSLQAKVVLEKTQEPGVEIISKDYQSSCFYPKADFTEEKLRGGHFGPLSFIAWILSSEDSTQGLKVSLESGSPPGSGLGGSSAMGVTLMKGLRQLKNEDYDPHSLIAKTQSLESIILNAGPAGYQDYFPALYGGILALRPHYHQIAVDQFYSEQLAEILELSLTLVHSGEQRQSGINNWEVYKGFFDGNKKIRSGLTEIAQLCHEAQGYLRSKHFEMIPQLIAREGELRESLFPGIVTEAMRVFLADLRSKSPRVGMKVCGAGGGGAFLLVHEPSDSGFVEQAILDHGMKKCEFKILPPLEKK